MMVLSREDLGWLDMRLRAVQPDKDKKSKPFGGYHVFFFGDFRQIQPVGGKVMYAETDVDSNDEITRNMNTIGRELYSTLDASNLGPN